MALVRAEQAENALLGEQEAHRVTQKQLRELQFSQVPPPHRLASWVTSFVAHCLLPLDGFGQAEERRETRTQERAKAQREIAALQQASHVLLLRVTFVALPASSLVVSLAPPAHVPGCLLVACRSLIKTRAKPR